MKPNQPNVSTIAAIATAPGDGAIGIIRISGPKALVVAKKMVRFKHSPPQKVQTLTRCSIFCKGKPVDKGMIAIFKAPKSYTGEDVVELFCHGGWRLLNLILEEILKNGAKLAEPGEFTKRAFLNGKIDLTQAESIMDLVHAPTLQMAQSAFQQVNGELYQAIVTLKKEIGFALSMVNASIDFEGDDQVSLDRKGIITRLQNAYAQLKPLVEHSEMSLLIHHGMKVSIIGPPNVGKSSLINILLKEEKAIVHDQEGTTRDVLNGAILIHGLRVDFFDTAGLRETQEVVENEGVKRSFIAAEQSDLILWVVDMKKPNYQIPDSLFNKKILLVFNKIDLTNFQNILPPHVVHLPTCRISALQGKGIDVLKEKIFEILIGSKNYKVEDHLIANLRQKQAAETAAQALKQAIEKTLLGEKEEMIAEELHIVSFALNEIVGYISPEEILDEIFKRFCLGK